MKIIIIGQKGIPSISGGVEKHVEELAVRLVKNRHEVIVYTRRHYTDKNMHEYKGVKLISLPSLNFKNTDAITHTFLACLNIIFKQKDVDVVHFHSIGPSLLIWMIKIFRPDIKIVATFHTQCYFHKKWGLFAKLFLRLGERMACVLPDKTITVSKILSNYVRGRYLTTEEYIPNGVFINKKYPVKEIRKWKLEKNNYILSVSRLVKHKGIHYLIEAFNNIKTDKKLVITGSETYTDNYVKELKRLAGNNKNIIFTGNQSGRVLNELFSNTSLFVMPSETEGLSIALLESMAYGCNILMSDIPENLEVANKIAHTFKNGDVKDLASKLDNIIKNKLVSNKKLAKNKILKEYNWDIIVRNIEQVYFEVLTASNKLVVADRNI